MFQSGLLSFREVLEAVLVIGIMLTYLSQNNKKNLSKFVYLGGILGLGVSLIGGFIGFSEAKELEDGSEAIFEGIMMLVASGLIAYFVVWMSNQNKNISSGIKSSVDKNSTGLGLFVLAFLSVFREGIELVAFILSKLSESASDVALGTGIGLVFAILVGYIIFKTSVKLNLKIVFKILGLVLIFIGAELFGESLVKLIPLANEGLEEIAAILFGGISLLYFLKNDISKYIKKSN